jgi:M penetrans paralogue family 26
MENKEIHFQEPIHRNDQHYWQQQLPNSNTILALGIISILTSFCFGFIGLILGIISLVLASKANKLYLDNPGTYTIASYSNMKAGKICAIVGTCFSAIYLLIMIIYIAFIAAFFTSLPWDMMAKP